jgi:hypothetical protein
MIKYTIHRTEIKPSYNAFQWESSVWQNANTLHVDKFHPQSSNHHPKTEAKLLYDEKNLYVIFRVEDHYVKAVYPQYQDPVYNDSCVEFFVMPDQMKGYFNFEINCIGTMLLYYIENPTRIADGFEKYDLVPQELVSQMTIFHSIAGKGKVEIETPIEWYIEYNIPFSLFEAYLGHLNRREGTIWKGNFYKCGDQTSHPHWASWSPIGKHLNFHQPDYFGSLEFGKNF